MTGVTRGFLNIKHKRADIKAAMKARQDEQASKDGVVLPEAAGAVQRKGRETLESIWWAVTEPVTLWFIVYLVFAFLGVFVERYFFSLQLLDFVNRSETLRNVVRAVTIPFTQLLYTMILGVVVMYIFASFAFWYMRAQFIVYNDDGGVFYYECERLSTCVVTFIDQGLRNGGGIGDYLQRQEVATPTWAFSAAFNVLYFFVIPIVFLNIIFGVIIDTFGALREDESAKREDMTSICCICGLSRELLDRHGSGFVTHTKEEHCMWSYLKYIIYIRSKDATEFTGVEQYIHELVEAEDTSWFPAGRAMMLSVHAGGEGGEGVEDASQSSRAVAGMLGALGQTALAAHLLFGFVFFIRFERK